MRYQFAIIGCGWIAPSIVEALAQLRTGRTSDPLQIRADAIAASLEQGKVTDLLDLQYRAAVSTIGGSKRHRTGYKCLREAGKVRRT